MNEPTSPQTPTRDSVTSSDLLEFLLPIILVGLAVWGLHHGANQARQKQIAEYERIYRETGKPPQYYIMGIPVNWTPYDE